MLDSSFCDLQVSKKTTVESVFFHAGESSDTYFASSPRGAAHVLYLTQAALSSFWKDSPYTWDAPKAQIGPVAVAIGGRSVLHVGSSRGCHAPLVCSRMEGTLSNLRHTEVAFENPQWVAAMDNVVTESSPEHLVMKRTLVCFDTCVFDPYDLVCILGKTPLLSFTFTHR